ncbi:MAG: hypothetical protein ACR2FJ_00625 [Qipengyuania sp.]
MTDDNPAATDLPEIEHIESSDDVEDGYAREHSMVDATIRCSRLRRILNESGLFEVGEGAGLLDRIGLHLRDEKDMLFEPGELICSAETTFANTGADVVYFLDVDPRGVAEDFAGIYNCSAVADSLTRSRLGLSKWEECPASYDLPCEQAPVPWVSTFREVAKSIGLAHTQIPAANLIFARSKRFRALKTRWEQLLDCLVAHRLIVDAIQPGLLWATGENFDISRDLLMLEEIEWHEAHDGRLQFGRGRIEFCGRWMDFAFTPSLSSWSPSDPDYREMVRWTFPGRAKSDPPVPAVQA